MKLHIIVIVVVACGLAAACSAGDDDLTAQAQAQALARSTAVDRAMQWVNAKLKYCQSANHAHDYDAACSSVCSRENNADWDPYRSDCSGLVSWAWGLPAPGRVTTQFAPFDTAVSHVIPGETLQPGDALNSSEHIFLFKQWVSPGKQAVFLEEPGCSSSQPYAHAFTSNVSINGSSVYVSYEGKTFTAIRYDGISGSGGGGGGEKAPPPSAKHGCFSESLDREVPFNTCVQNVTSGDWFQCDAGKWVDRWSDPSACVASYPIGSKGECWSHTLDREIQVNACVQSEVDDRWYECEGGAWVDRWTDPSACNGVYPYDGKHFAKPRARAYSGFHSSGGVPPTSVIPGTCTHGVCTAGDKLGQACNSCTMKVCEADPYCCDTFWGLSCFADVQQLCGQTCP